MSRDDYKILILDNEEPKNLYILHRYGFNIDHKFDISSLEELDRYDIILYDTNNIGSLLGVSSLNLINDIKKRYQDKFIVLCSVFYNSDFYFDWYMHKDYGIANTIDALDRIIQACRDCKK